MKAGLFAGAIATILAVLVSLPLRSPDDVFLNSFTVSMGGLMAAPVAGLVWGRLKDWKRFAVVWAGLFLLAIALVVAGELFLNRFIAYSLPLAAIVFAVTGVLTVMFGRLPNLSWWPGALGSLAALGLGFALITFTDQEGGALILPPTPVPTLTPVQTPTAMLTASPQATEPAPGGSPTAQPSPAATEAPTAPAARQPGEIDGYVFRVGEDSKATFTVNETLASLPAPIDAVVFTEAITGSIRLDGLPSEFTIDLHQLTSDQPNRDRYIRTRMFPDDRSAVIVFHEVPPAPELATGDVIQRQVSGEITIQGHTAPLAFNVEARDDGSQLAVVGRTTFTWDELDIPTPSTRTVTVREQVRVEVLLITTPEPAQ